MIGGRPLVRLNAIEATWVIQPLRINEIRGAWAALAEWNPSLAKEAPSGSNFPRPDIQASWSKDLSHQFPFRLRTPPNPSSRGDMMMEARAGIERECSLPLTNSTATRRAEQLSMREKAATDCDGYTAAI